MYSTEYRGHLSTAYFDVTEALHGEHVIYAGIHANLVNYRNSCLLRTGNTDNAHSAHYTPFTR